MTLQHQLFVISMWSVDGAWEKIMELLQKNYTIDNTKIRKWSKYFLIVKITIQNKASCCSNKQTCCLWSSMKAAAFWSEDIWNIFLWYFSVDEMKEVLRLQSSVVIRYAGHTAALQHWRGNTQATHITKNSELAASLNTVDSWSE